MTKQSELEEIATRDDLTQLQNRRFFYQRLQEELESAITRQRQLSVVMIDVDDLKLLNDEFGHQVGDIILRQFARILNHDAGPGHVTARLGGDEFAVIMPDTDRRTAEQFGWRIWDELAAGPIHENENASIYLGVSVGIGGYPWGGSDIEEIIHWADTKLYANKLERKGFKRISDERVNSRLASAVVEVLSSALDVRDRMTHRHARRVARLAVAVARELGLSEAQVLEIEFAAALHDIGKIGVADSILRKSAALDAEEWKDMRRHSELGYEILKGIDFLKDAAEIVYAHHERFDGGGYPRGLSGEEIPLGARLFSIVDAYDAMTSRRPYRSAGTRESACQEIERNVGTQFDPTLVEAFLKVIRRSAAEEYTDWDDDYGPRVETPEKPEAVAPAALAR
ncbi:MAG: diguanylate cyclase [Chloroflexi bacterium]|nr:MAG: diguanylate cyclase [Chloroflexota bacterium]